MPVFYFDLSGDRGDEIVSIVASLEEHFAVKSYDALKVETDVEFLFPLLKALQTPKPDPIQEAAVELVQATKKTITKPDALQNRAGNLPQMR